MLFKDIECKATEIKNLDLMINHDNFSGVYIGFSNNCGFYERIQPSRMSILLTGKLFQYDSTSVSKYIT